MKRFALALALALNLAPAAGRAQTAGDTEPTVVNDYVILEVRFSPTEETLDLVDVISEDNPIDEVTVRFVPVPGFAQRLRFLAPDGSFGPWTAWTIGRVQRVLPVPEAGETSEDIFEAETRKAGGPTIASSGYIRVKKLNSGG